MKLFRHTLLALILGSLLTGCTYTHPEQDQEIQQIESSRPLSSPSSARMEGTFQSQAVATTGTAFLEVNESGAVLQLENMATEPGKDLRVMLSPGTLSSGAGGQPALSSTQMIEIGPFRSGATQRFVMDSKMWAGIQEPVRSVLIYDYAARTSYGTANLSDSSSAPHPTNTGMG